MGKSIISGPEYNVWVKSNILVNSIGCLQSHIAHGRLNLIAHAPTVAQPCFNSIATWNSSWRTTQARSSPTVEIPTSTIHHSSPDLLNLQSLWYETNGCLYPFLSGPIPDYPRLSVNIVTNPNKPPTSKFLLTLRAAYWPPNPISPQKWP